VPAPETYDGVLATDLMSIADLKALWHRRCPPILLYFHENQFSYPLGPDASPDYQYGFTHMSSALAADTVYFNSRTHFEHFFAGLASFLTMMPDCRPRWVIREIRAKSGVLHPGCRFPSTDALADSRYLRKQSPPLIVWNHRWEHDKNPRDFFDAIGALKAAGLPFRLALLGERFQKIPPEFVAARKRFAKELVCFEYENSRARYEDWLKRGAVIVSTARQENFGMAVIEAVRCGCYPLLPSRLSYPEIIPRRFHGDVLYANQTELIEKLIAVVGGFRQTLSIRTQLAESMQKFAWPERIGDFDRALEKLYRNARRTK
jgi:glycosyltransferase involved in cell wall biosynthesis